MSVRVQLDLPLGDVYTNLDFVTGRVILTLPTDATISAITVKLEGESKTRLDGPKSPLPQDQDRKKTLLEVHKLLYKVQTVFPTSQLQESVQSNTYSNYRTSQYTLLRGQYEYPFRFKIDFNSDCVNNTSLIKDLKLGALSVQYGQEPMHAKLPLPPTLSGYPGEAEIKYFVKATVVRPKFYQENLRNEVPIAFLPIERPRPPLTDAETFGRRKHQFQKVSNGEGRRKSLFRQNSGLQVDEESLAFQVDARLPSPAIITCRQSLPLRILVDRLNSNASTLYLSTLQIELIGTTEVRAHDLQRKETGSWTLVSLANLSMPLNYSADKRNGWTIPAHFWENVPLPTSVAPTFKTCNISRTYEIEVRVGLSHGLADGVRPETIMSSIRLEVEVWSGIAPPPQLLAAMRNSQKNGTHLPNTEGLQISTDMGIKPQTYTQPSPHQFPPVSPRPTSAGNIQFLPAGSHALHTNSTPDDLPPSYEDAIAADLAPVDGPRPSGYSAGEDLPSQGPAFNPDSKSGLGRRVSERLFASNAPRAPRSGPSNRVTSADMSRYGGDTVAEEPDDLITDTRDLSIRSDEPSSRPPLPARKPSGQYQGTINSPGGYDRKQAEI